MPNPRRFMVALICSASAFGCVSTEAGGGAGSGGAKAMGSGGSSNGSGSGGSNGSGGSSGNGSGGDTASGSGGVSGSGGQPAGNDAAATGGSGGAPSDGGGGDMPAVGGAACDGFTSKFCDDFEKQTSGQAPAGAFKVSAPAGAMIVDGTKPFGGTKSVHVKMAAPASAAEMTFSSQFPFNEEHGRLMMFMSQVPTNQTHWDVVHSRNPSTDWEVGGQFGNFELVADPPDNGLDSKTKFPVGKWFCLQWEFKYGGTGMPNTFVAKVDGTAVDQGMFTGPNSKGEKLGRRAVAIAERRLGRLRDVERHHRDVDRRSGFRRAGDRLPGGRADVDRTLRRFVPDPGFRFPYSKMVRLGVATEEFPACALPTRGGRRAGSDQRGDRWLAVRVRGGAFFRRIAGRGRISGGRRPTD